MKKCSLALWKISKMLNSYLFGGINHHQKSSIISWRHLNHQNRRFKDFDPKSEETNQNFLPQCTEEGIYQLRIRSHSDLPSLRPDSLDLNRAISFWHYSIHRSRSWIMSLGARSILEKRSTATRGAFIFVFSPVIIVMIRVYETPPLIIIMTRGKERQVAPTDFPGKKAHPTI